LPIIVIGARRDRNLDSGKRFFRDFLGTGDEKRVPSVAPHDDRRSRRRSLSGEVGMVHRQLQPEGSGRA
jgi:hypothetical protein